MPTDRSARTRTPRDTALGGRVRALRLAKGLTQQQLGGTELSKSYVSLVEQGLARPSLRAATVLARRLGVSVSELAEDASPAAELSLVRAESAALTDRGAALAILDEHAAAFEGVTRARAAILRGRLLMDERPAMAAALLEDAVRIGRDAGRRDLVAQATLGLAKVHLHAERPGDALDLALSVERMLRDGTVVDRTLELQTLRALSAIFGVMGDWDAADRWARRALAVAEDVGDPLSLARLYAQLSTIREEQRDFEGALGYAQRSLTLREAVGTSEEIGRLWNNIGWILVSRGHFGRAAEALTKAERIGKANGQRRLLAMVAATRAELAAARGDDGEALALADRAASDADASTFCRAQAKLVRAEVVARDSSTPLADVRAAFADALAEAKPLPRQQHARAHEAFFRALVARGEHALAAVEADAAIECLKPRPITTPA